MFHTFAPFLYRIFPHQDTSIFHLIYLSIYLAIYLDLVIYLDLSIYLSIYPSIYLFVYLVRLVEEAGLHPTGLLLVRLQPKI